MGSRRQPDTESVLREQFRTLDMVSQPLNLDRDRQRRVLLIGQRDWMRWSNFLRDGPLPAHPAPSVMLRRLGTATYRLASLAERRSP